MIFQPKRGTDRHDHATSHASVETVVMHETHRLEVVVLRPQENLSIRHL